MTKTIKIPVQLPEPTSFFWRQARAKTFNKWPFKVSDKCNSECMAAAGFYVIGDSNEPDLVQCFICGKQLDGWEATDDPWSEHEKHQSSCPFLKLNKQNEKDWTVGELYDLYKEFKLREYMNDFNKKINGIKDEAKQLRYALSSIHESLQRKKTNSS